MKIDEPAQRPDPQVRNDAAWGLGPCNASQRWGECQTYLFSMADRGTREGLVETLRSAGCPMAIAGTVVNTWLQAGMIHDHGSHISMGGRPLDATDRLSRGVGLAPQDSDSRQPSNEHRLALLSLFGGTGLARVAIEEIVRESPGITLVDSAFAEHDEILSDRVEAVWRRQHQLGHTRVPHRAIARDVWDLFRDERFPLGTNAGINEISEASITPLLRFTRPLPERCVVMIVAGPPCQQLTHAGRHRGKQGLCGPDSVLFFAVPQQLGTCSRSGLTCRFTLRWKTLQVCSHCTKKRHHAGARRSHSCRAPPNHGLIELECVSLAATLLPNNSGQGPCSQSQPERQPVGHRMGAHSISGHGAYDVLSQPKESKTIHDAVSCAELDLQVCRG